MEDYACFKRRADHVPNLIQGIKHMISSTFETIKFGSPDYRSYIQFTNISHVDVCHLEINKVSQEPAWCRQLLAKISDGSRQSIERDELSSTFETNVETVALSRT